MASGVISIDSWCFVSAFSALFWPVSALGCCAVSVCPLFSCKAWGEEAHPLMKTAARNVDNVNSTARVCVFLYFVGFSDFMLEYLLFILSNNGLGKIILTKPHRTHFSNLFLSPSLCGYPHRWKGKCL